MSVPTLVEKSVLREEVCDQQGPREALSISFPVEKWKVLVLHLLSGLNEGHPAARALSEVLGDLMNQRPF